MNENKKWRGLLIGAVVIVFLLSTIMGYYIGRGRTDSRITEAQSTIDNLRITVGELNRTITNTNLEVEKLGRLRDTDKETISQLEDFNIRLSKAHNQTAKLVEEQRHLIEEITSGSDAAGRSSSEITSGLRQAIRTIDSIIKSIQDRED